MSNVVFYRCEKCGNIIALIKNGGGKLVCCGQPMTKLEANTTDAAVEKHVPVVSKEDGKTIVKVGSVPHPMVTEHYIEWVALLAGDKMELQFLQPDQEPKAEFAGISNGTAYAFCNLHSLWKAEF